jgi:aspartate racemase
MQALRIIGGLLISNVSFPKYLEEEIAVKGKSAELILPYLLNSIKQLENAGADFIVLPCNTLHAVIEKLREATPLEVIDLVELVSLGIKKQYKQIGILATSKTRQERLYDKSLAGMNLQYPSDEEQQKISEIIIRIIRSQSNESDRLFLEGVIKRLIEGGAEKVLLACTDLSNVIKNNPFTLDSTDILINEIKQKTAE